MGCYTRTSGTIRINDTPESRAIVAAIEEDALDGNVTVTQEGDYLLLDINVYGDTSYNHASQIDARIQSLEPWATGCFRFDGACDDELGWFYVGGTDKAKRIAHSVYVLQQEITPRLGDLTPEDQQKLKEML